jgi:hypothetical protein
MAVNKKKILLYVVVLLSKVTSTKTVYIESFEIKSLLICPIYEKKFFTINVLLL